MRGVCCTSQVLALSPWSMAASGTLLWLPQPAHVVAFVLDADHPGLVPLLSSHNISALVSKHIEQVGASGGLTITPTHCHMSHVDVHPVTPFVKHGLLSPVLAPEASI